MLHENLVYCIIIGYTQIGCRHAGENRHSVLIDDWIPAFAGMTYALVFQIQYISYHSVLIRKNQPSFSIFQ